MHQLAKRGKLLPAKMVIERFGDGDTYADEVRRKRAETAKAITVWRRKNHLVRCFTE
jgi:hypothetical protein